jgi:hypothetical protein
VSKAVGLDEVLVGGREIKTPPKFLDFQDFTDNTPSIFD